MNDYLAAKKEDFNRAIEFFRNDIASLRTGRAHASLVDGVQVEAYGTKTPINGVATISTPDAKSLVITPWDKTVTKEVEKALVEANLGAGIVNEGERVRIVLPPMTEENRREMVRKLNEKTEAARVAVRQVREEVKIAVETAEENKEIGEDDRFRFVKELDEEVRRLNEEIKALRDRKEEEIMTV